MAADTWMLHAQYPGFSPETLPPYTPLLRLPFLIAAWRLAPWSSTSSVDPSAAAGDDADISRSMESLALKSGGCTEGAEAALQAATACGLLSAVMDLPRVRSLMDAICCVSYAVDTATASAENKRACELRCNSCAGIVAVPSAAAPVCPVDMARTRDAESYD